MTVKGKHHATPARTTGTACAPDSNLVGLVAGLVEWVGPAVIAVLGLSMAVIVPLGLVG
ncbi:hypothetical protein ACWDSJ_24465 [Nocardia sp. NPDC003482]|uniref:hypothetical protein n=1 Tax=Nocardia sp. NPDC004068 TaxID=3364303 RepID=UPI0036B5DCFC